MFTLYDQYSLCTILVVKHHSLGDIYKDRYLPNKGTVKKYSSIIV